MRTPLTVSPASSPPSTSGPKVKPTSMGVMMASAPGSHIALRAACVAMFTHRSYSGCAVPCSMPFISWNCLLTSCTMAMAALPTALIVRAENRNGIMLPMSRPAMTGGL